MSLTTAELERYSRHISIPEVGTEGQEKLKRAKVLCIGAGGLGAPLSLYLAAAGVGMIGLVDFDKIDFTNLQRQVLYGTNDVGKSKLSVAKERLNGINPEVKIQLHETHLSSSNALDLFKNYDIIVDGTDNFPTRYLVNDACVLSGKPNVYGSIFRFEGQVAVFDAIRGPCYRCLYPEPPPPGLVPSCAEGGVLGALPGIIGTLQALETIKLILNEGNPLIGRLLLFDAMKMKFRELTLKKDPECPICSSKRSITKLIDYSEMCEPNSNVTHSNLRAHEEQAFSKKTRHEQFCGTKPKENAMSQAGDMEVEELKKLRDAKADVAILDVRESWEWDMYHFPESKHIPLGELGNRINELDKNKEFVVHCRSGGRSAKAVSLLKQSGFTNSRNLTGGILAWADRIDPSVPKY